MENHTKIDVGLTLPESIAKTLTSKDIKIIKKYDPYQDPPDLEMAFEHGKAKKVYQRNNEDKCKTEKKKACPCCGLAIEGKPLPLNTDLKEIYYLGSGYASYFVFIKYSTVLLLLLFFTSGLFNLLTNYYGNDCPTDVNNVVDGACRESIILRFALNNKRDDIKLLSVSLVLNFASVIVIIVFFHLMRYQFRKAERNVDNETITPSDYTIQLKGVEPTLSDREIISWLKKFGKPQHPLNVVKINRTYNIKKYMERSRQKEKLMKKQAKYAKNQNKARLIDRKINEIEAYFEAFKKKKLVPTSTIFVVFQTSAEAEYVRDKFQKGYIREKFEHFFSHFLNTYDQLAGRKITVERAPEPTDIIWENLHSTVIDQIKRKIIAGCVTVTLVIIGLCIVVLMNWLQKIAKEEYSGRIVWLFSFLSSVLIFIWDLIVALIIKKLANSEKNPTLTSYYTGVAGKLSIIQLINSGFTTLFAKIIIANDFSFSLSFKEKLRAVNVYEKGGLVDNMYFVFIIYAVLQPLLTLIDPLDLYKRWMQRRVKSHKTTIKMNQKQAHNFFESSEIDMSDKYATLIRTILVASFYAPAMPFALIYSVLGLILTYWIDKYVLLRRTALPKSLNNELADSMIEYLEWMAFMFAIGSFLFIYTLQNSSHKDLFDELPQSLVWITLGISLFHIYFPMGWLNKKIFRINIDINEIGTYKQARFEFTTDYDIENPITRKKALRDFMFQVKGMIEMGSYDKQVMSTKEGAFAKLTFDDILKLMDPNNNEDYQDFQFLEKYALEARQSSVLERKRTIANLRMDLIKVLSKFELFKKKHTKNSMVSQFITNAKYSIGIREYSERESTEGNIHSRDNFKSVLFREMSINSYEFEGKEDDYRPNNRQYRLHKSTELSRFAEDRILSPMGNVDDDDDEEEFAGFQIREEFAQRRLELHHKEPLQKSKNY